MNILHPTSNLKPLKILIFSWRGPGHPLAGGAEIVTHEHAKAWVKAGHNVILFTSFFPGGKAEEILDGVRIIRKGKDFVGVKINAIKWYLTLKDKPDLVFDHFHGIPFFTPLYVKEKKIAFIHEVTKEVWFLNYLPFPKNLIYGVLGYLSEPWIFRLYRNIPFLTVSESTKEDLKNWGIKGVTVIHNGIHSPKSDIGDLKSRTKTAIFFGAVSRDKGIIDAMKAFSEINKADKNWQFWVAGNASDKYRELMREMAAKLGIRTKFKYWGRVTDRRKFELLARAHVLINPSVREGWGIVNIEANSVGTPVVGYNVAGTRDSVKNGETGILVKNGDFGGLASNALKLLSNENLYRLFEKRAYQWSKNFTWGKSVKQSTKFIENI